MHGFIVYAADNADVQYLPDDECQVLLPDAFDPTSVRPVVGEHDRERLDNYTHTRQQLHYADRTDIELIVKLAVYLNNATIEGKCSVVLLYV